MKQAIAGVSPSELGEVTITALWPSMAGGSMGMLLGRLYAIRFGIGSVLTVGNLLALAFIPLSLTLFALNILPFIGRRYRLTNRRVLVEQSGTSREIKAVSLDDFDAIDVVVHPGQEWYPAGDLIFRKGTIETFRLVGVLRPEGFRQICMKAQRSHAGVKRVMAAQGAGA
jgi:hypothetical protein